MIFEESSARRERAFVGEQEKLMDIHATVLVGRFITKGTKPRSYSLIINIIC